MASKSLYRKYRPQTFSDVVGQEHIEQTLRNALSNDRVAHAYLFCGPRGTGKTTTARLLAKALLCEKAPTANPCGVCQNCKDIAESTHPDVYEIDAASRTGVDNVREEIIGRVAFSPTRGRYKIYIIDEVHMLSSGAFNALLKTLEEPPDHIVFVMCTTESHKVPQTIISRCQRFDFHSLTAGQIRQCLEHICEGEGFTYDDDGIDLIAEQAKGGMRDAITALEQVSVFGNGHISFEAAQNMFGDVDTERLSQIIDCIAKRDMQGCFAWVEEVSRTGIDTAQTARDLAAYVRNIYLIAIAGRTEALPPMAPDMLEVLERQAKDLGSANRIASMLITLGNLMAELRVSADSRLSLEIALTKMAHINTELTLESLSARIDALELGGGAVFGSVVPSAGSGVRVGHVEEDVSASVTPEAAHSVLSSAPESELVSSFLESTSSTLEPATSPVQGQSNVSSAQEQSSVSSALEQSSAQSQQSQSTPATSYLKDPGSLRRLWDSAVRSVGAEHAMIPGLMAGARPHANLRDMKITVELPSDADFALNTLSRADSMQWMRDALKKSFGTEVQLEYKLGSVPSQPSQITPQPEQPLNAGNAAANPASQVVESEMLNTPPDVRAPQQDVLNPPVEESMSLSTPNDTSAELPTAPLPPQNKPASGDMELANILGDVFEDGVEYRAPN